MIAEILGTKQTRRTELKMIYKFIKLTIVHTKFRKKLHDSLVYSIKSMFRIKKAWNLMKQL